MVLGGYILSIEKRKEFNKSIIETKKVYLNKLKEELQTALESNNEYKKELNLSKQQYDRWSSKKYLAVYEIVQLEEIIPFKYNREKNMDDWIITDDINKIKSR